MVRVITVRLDEATFLAVRNAAFDDRRSMNSWCVAVLAEAAGDAVIPQEEQAAVPAAAA